MGEKHLYPESRNAGKTKHLGISMHIIFHHVWMLLPPTKWPLSNPRLILQSQPWSACFSTFLKALSISFWLLIASWASKKNCLDRQGWSSQVDSWEIYEAHMSCTIGLVNMTKLLGIPRHRDLRAGERKLAPKSDNPNCLRRCVKQKWKCQPPKLLKKRKLNWVKIVNWINWIELNFIWTQTNQVNNYSLDILAHPDLVRLSSILSRLQSPESSWIPKTHPAGYGLKEGSWNNT